jgi:hypothetical protein
MKRVPVRPVEQTMETCFGMDLSIAFSVLKTAAYCHFFKDFAGRKSGDLFHQPTDAACET